MQQKQTSEMSSSEIFVELESKGYLCRGPKMDNWRIRDLQGHDRSVMGIQRLREFLHKVRNGTLPGWVTAPQGPEPEMLRKQRERNAAKTYRLRGSLKGRDIDEVVVGKDNAEQRRKEYADQFCIVRVEEVQ